MAIKNVGEAAVDAIIAERNANGDFTDLEDPVKPRKRRKQSTNAGSKV